MKELGRYYVPSAKILLAEVGEIDRDLHQIYMLYTLSPDGYEGKRVYQLKTNTLNEHVTETLNDLLTYIHNNISGRVAEEFKRLINNDRADTQRLELSRLIRNFMKHLDGELDR